MRCAIVSGLVFHHRAFFYEMQGGAVQMLYGLVPFRGSTAAIVGLKKYILRKRCLFFRPNYTASGRLQGRRWFGGAAGALCIRAWGGLFSTPI